MMAKQTPTRTRLNLTTIAEDNALLRNRDIVMGNKIINLYSHVGKINRNTLPILTHDNLDDIKFTDIKYIENIIELVKQGKIIKGIKAPLIKTDIWTALPEESFLEKLVGISLSDASIIRSIKYYTYLAYWQSGTVPGHTAHSLNLLNDFKGYVKNHEILSIQDNIKLKGYDKTYEVVGFLTLSAPLFGICRSLFYRLDRITGKYMKTLPYNITDMFTLRSLAYCIQDNGHFHKTNGTLVLCTDALTEAEVNILCNHIYDLITKANINSTNPLNNKFDITVTEFKPSQTGGINRSTIRMYYRLYINKTSMDLIRLHVGPYMNSSLLTRKLGLID